MLWAEKNSLFTAVDEMPCQPPSSLLVRFLQRGSGSYPLELVEVSQKLSLLPSRQKNGGKVSPFSTFVVIELHCWLLYTKGTLKIKFLSAELRCTVVVW